MNGVCGYCQRDAVVVRGEERYCVRCYDERARVKSKADEMMDAYLAAHPELKRDEDETRSEYRRRSLEMLRAGLRRFGSSA